MSALPKYDLYKDSGVERLGEIPSHWKVIRLRDVFKFGKGLSITKENLQEDGVPCVNYGEVHSKYGFEVTPEKHELKCVDLSYLDRSPKALLKHGDFVFADTSEDIEGSGNFTYLNSDISTFAGYHTVVARTSNKNKRYLAYALDSLPFRSQLRQRVKGVKVYSITQSLLRQNYLWFPTEDEQERIVSFLDHKTTEIDEATVKKTKLIGLLKEQKAILINQAVTKGLNPKVQTKDSGIEWIGDIPKHWEVLRAKYVFNEVDERSKSGQEELLSVSHMTGVTPRSEKNVGMFLAEDYTGSKLCRDGDLVINIMWAWMGALGVSDRTGIISPSYGVFKQKKKVFTHWFLEHLLRSKQYVSEYNRRSTGLHSSRLRLYADYFLRMEVGIPPLEEQEAIQQQVTMHTAQIDEVIQKTEEEIAKIKELRQIIISEVVTGKVRV